MKRLFIPLLGLLAWQATAQTPPSPTPPLKTECEQLYASQAYADAAQVCEPLADQGNAQAQLILGLLYLNGQDVPGDPQRAVSYLLQAAGQQVAQAQYEVGMAYLLGRGGIGRNVVAGVEWLQKAGEQNYPAALAELGVYYSNSLQDYQKSLSYTRRAACLNDLTGQRNLIRSLYYGIGVAKNCKQAAWWARKASEKDDLSRQNYRMIIRDAKCLPDPNFNPCGA